MKPAAPVTRQRPLIFEGTVRLSWRGSRSIRVESSPQDDSTAAVVELGVKQDGVCRRVGRAPGGPRGDTAPIWLSRSSHERARSKHRLAATPEHRAANG